MEQQKEGKGAWLMCLTALASCSWCSYFHSFFRHQVRLSVKHSSDASSDSPLYLSTWTFVNEGLSLLSSFIHCYINLLSEVLQKNLSSTFTTVLDMEVVSLYCFKRSHTLLERKKERKKCCCLCHLESFRLFSLLTPLWEGWGHNSPFNPSWGAMRNVSVISQTSAS